MAGIRLEFAQFGDFDSFSIYRSNSTMDVGSLPTPIATGLATMYYVDTTVVEGSTYYYRVAVVKAGVIEVSSEVSLIAAIAFRYYRIYMTSNNGDSYYALNLVMLATSVGGATITTSGMTCYQSDYFALGSNVWQQTLNGNTDVTNGWVSNGSAAPHWGTIDLGAPATIAEVRMSPQNRSDLVSRAPKDFLIQGSNDNATWTTLKTVVGETSWTASVFNSYVL